MDTRRHRDTPPETVDALSTYHKHFLEGITPLILAETEILSGGLSV